MLPTKIEHIQTMGKIGLFTKEDRKHRQAGHEAWILPYGLVQSKDDREKAHRIKNIHVKNNNTCWTM